MANRSFVVFFVSSLQLMKGKIWIESEGAEQGTTCHFYFQVKIIYNYEFEAHHELFNNLPKEQYIELTEAN